MAAPTRDFERTNPAAIARGTINATRELQMMKVVLAVPSGDDAVIGSDAVAQHIGEVIGAFTGLFQIKANGTEIYMVTDRHDISIDTVALEIGMALETGDITSSDFGISSAGVCTLIDNSTITVTIVTDIEGL
jgi:hypothetical protein|tara:strand:+ start:327 stop:725 length:399 start_codon:yes stop_codon:yes gene_type:complete